MRNTVRIDVGTYRIRPECEHVTDTTADVDHTAPEVAAQNGIEKELPIDLRDATAALQILEIPIVVGQQLSTSA
jgi:hypothetical protein